MPLTAATSTPPPEATATSGVELAMTRTVDKQVLLQFAADPTDWFQMDVTEVTNAQYQACVANGGCTGSYAGFSTAFYAADHPVVGVTGDQAAAYCAWAGGRLPTVEEWLAAATTNGEYDYPWGDDEKKDLSTYAVVDQKRCEGTDAGTCPVGSKSPAGDSPAGIQDLIGNVWEWTGDSGKKKQNAMVAGGSWSDKAKDTFFDTPLSKHIIRETAIDPKDPQDDLGFRCVYDGLANQN
jgi:formylglycine-generating enzyme required for sulfatase activity